MNFLNDKKNLPIIIAVAAVVIIGAVVSGLYFGGVIGQPAPSPVVASNPSTPGGAYPGMPTGPGMAGAPGMTPGAPTGPGVPSGPGMRPMGQPAGPGGPMGAPTGIRPGATSRTLSLGGGPSAGEKRPVGTKIAKGHGKVIGARPVGAPGMPGPKVADVPADPNKVTFVGDPTVGPDPFYTKPPPRIKVPGFGTRINLNGDDTINPLPPITPPTNGTDGPIMPINTVDPNGPTPDQPVINDELRRVSGILHSSDGVYAVLETNGVSQTVQPGDDVGGAKVTAIDDNGVTLKTTDTHLTLHVPLSDTASVVNK